jgi:hypothetical protein
MFMLELRGRERMLDQRVYGLLMDGSSATCLAVIKTKGRLRPREAALH